MKKFKFNELEEEVRNSLIVDYLEYRWEHDCIAEEEKDAIEYLSTLEFSPAPYV